MLNQFVRRRPRVDLSNTAEVIAEQFPGSSSGVRPDCPELTHDDEGGLVGDADVVDDDGLVVDPFLAGGGVEVPVDGPELEPEDVDVVDD